MPRANVGVFMIVGLNMETTTDYTITHVSDILLSMVLTLGRRDQQRMGAPPV